MMIRLPISLPLRLSADDLVSLPRINISARNIDDSAAIGSTVANLTISDGGAAWAFSLLDNAGGRFAISGDKLVVGLTTLDHDDTPTPSITVQATDGKRTVKRTFTMNVRRPLPALPLATGAQVAAIGDSQIAYNTFQSGSIAAEGAHKNALGFITHTQSLDPRFRWDNWYEPSDPTGRNLGGGNQGVMSDHMLVSPSGTPQLGGIVGRLAAVLARKPDIIILEGGTNTISTGDGGDNSAALVIRSLETMLVMARSKGIHAILMTIYPRASWKANDPVRHGILQEVNAWIRSQAGRDGLLAVLDADPILLTQNGDVDAGKFQSDLIHLNAPGAIALGRSGLLPILQTAITAGSTFDMPPTVDNLFAPDRANMIGSTGAVTNGATGVAAAGFTIQATYGATAIIGSKEIISGALEAQVIDITPGETGDARLYGLVNLTPPSIISPALVAGDWVQAFIHIETDNEAAFSLARWQAAIRQGSTIRARSYGMQASSGNFSIRAGSEARSFWTMTEPLQVPDGVTFDRIYTLLEIYFDKTAAPFRLKISRPIVRKVADPRTLWGY